jgi:hypothetical protein
MKYIIRPRLENLYRQTYDGLNSDKDDWIEDGTHTVYDVVEQLPSGHEKLLLTTSSIKDAESQLNFLTGKIAL